VARKQIGQHLSTEPLPGPDPDAAGPLAGLRVVELASEYAAHCGRLLADYGAEVILIEPPGGAPQRWYEPFVDDVPDPERSLWFWHYNTNKFGVVVDLDDDEGRARFRDLVASADIVVEAEPPVTSPRSGSTTPTCARVTRGSSGPRSRRSGAPTPGPTSRPPT